MARAEGQPLHGELRMGVIPTIAPFLLPAMLPAPPRANGRASSSTCARRPARPPARRSTADSSTACCSPSPTPAARSIPRRCSTIRCSSPSRAAKPRAARTSTSPAIDENRMLLLEDGHCLKDHALSACNRPDLRAHAAMMGTSLHTLVQMVDNGLGVTFIPSMAIEAGILEGTQVDAKPLTLRPRLPADRADLAPVEPARSASSSCSPRRCARSCSTSVPRSRRSLPFPGARGRTRLISLRTRRDAGEGSVGAAAAEGYALLGHCRFPSAGR